jgi:hypothetical protein
LLQSIAKCMTNISTTDISNLNVTSPALYADRDSTNTFIFSVSTFDSLHPASAVRAVEQQPGSGMSVQSKSALLRTRLDPPLSSQEVSVTADPHTATAAAGNGVPSSSISVSYVVTSQQIGATYSQLSSQLQSSVSSGLFDTYLTQYATLLGAPGFVNCTSTNVSTADLLPYTADDDDGNTDDDDNSTSNKSMVQDIKSKAFLILSILFLACFIIGTAPYTYRLCIGAEKWSQKSPSLSSAANDVSGSARSSLSTFQSRMSENKSSFVSNPLAARSKTSTMPGGLPASDTTDYNM